MTSPLAKMTLGGTPVWVDRTARPHRHFLDAEGRRPVDPAEVPIAPALRQWLRELERRGKPTGARTFVRKVVRGAPRPAQADQPAKPCCGDKPAPPSAFAAE
jgi:hypothetical protein